ncbi:hypothetical protein BKA56DRAFT_566371, partial [Ilyonectria sp. MPI-CAGE-AT-0026]
MPSRLQCSALMVGIVGVLRTYWAWPDVGAFAQRRGGAATTAQSHWTSSQRLMCRRRSTRPNDFAPISSDFSSWTDVRSLQFQSPVVWQVNLATIRYGAQQEQKPILNLTCIVPCSVRTPHSAFGASCYGV